MTTNILFKNKNERRIDSELKSTGTENNQIVENDH